MELWPVADAYAAVRRAAVLGDNPYFRQDALPPALLHASGEPSSNWLYGKTQASAHADAAYKPGKFDLFGKQRHERRLLGAAMMQCTAELAEPTLLYALDCGGGPDETCHARIVAHVFSAPLAQLEADLVDSDRSRPTPFELSLHGDAKTAEHLVRLRATIGEQMRGCGLAALPGFLLTGDYHLQREGVVSMLRLRSPQTDLELEILERMCMTALQHDLAGPPGEGCLGPSEIGAIADLDWPSHYKFLTVFDRCEDEFEFLHRANWESSSTESHLVKYGDYKVARQDEASQLARRQVVVPLAAALLKCEGLSVSADKLAEVLAQATRFKREEACHMARDRDRDRVAVRSDDTVPLMKVMGMCPGAWRLRQMSRNGLNRECLAEMTNQIFENAVDADLASRDIDPMVLEEDDGGYGHGRSGTSFATVVQRIAERVNEPQAILVFRMGVGKEVHSVRLCGSAMARHSPNVRLDEAARLLSFPWVIPIAGNHATGPPNGVLMLEQTGVARDKLRVTDEVRVKYGARPNQGVALEDLVQMKRDMETRLIGLKNDLKKDLTISRTQVIQSLMPAPPAAPAAAAQPVAPTPCASPGQLPHSEARAALESAMGALARGMRKRKVEALSWQ